MRNALTYPMENNQIKRDDIHRPAEIVPSDYVYITTVSLSPKHEELEYNQEQTAYIVEHMASTGGKKSTHKHGGVCMVCGNNNLTYLAYFYHPKTNVYLVMGLDCAQKLNMGHENAFKTFKLGLENALSFKAGKAKAQAVLSEAGLSQAWAIYESFDASKGGAYEEKTISSMVYNLIKYGSFSDKQKTFCGALIAKIPERAKVQAQREAEKLTAIDCPSGRASIEGEVLSTKIYSSDFGDILKMTVKGKGGFMCFGTVPASLCSMDEKNEAGQFIGQRNVQRGDMVKFTASFTPSDSDKKFGFFKRPSGAQLVK